MYKILSILGLGFCLLSSAAKAADAPQVLGTFGDWTAYYYQEGKNPVCYMVASPRKEEGKYGRRGDVYAFVTHRPSENAFGMVNFVAGYNYKPNSNVIVKIGSVTVKNTFVDGDKAWSMSSKTDEELVAAMKKYDKMIVHGTSSKGNDTKDTYSLSGFSKAYRVISAKCKK